MGARWIAAFDLHGDRLFAFGPDVQEGQTTEPFDKGDRGRDGSVGIDVQPLGPDTERGGVTRLCCARGNGHRDSLPRRQ